MSKQVVQVKLLNEAIVVMVQMLTTVMKPLQVFVSKQNRLQLALFNVPLASQSVVCDTSHVNGFLSKQNQFFLLDESGAVCMVQW